MATIERLENWISGHKARSANINIDDHYGATCWVVELRGKEKKKVLASEVSFWCLTNGKELPPDVVSVMPPERAEWTEEEFEKYCKEVEAKWGDKWPGLEATINAALDRAEELGL